MILCEKFEISSILKSTSLIKTTFFCASHVSKIFLQDKTYLVFRKTLLFICANNQEPIKSFDNDLSFSRVI